MMLVMVTMLVVTVMMIIIIIYCVGVDYSENVHNDCCVGCDCGD